jgi:hypothetical protein
LIQGKKSRLEKSTLVRDCSACASKGKKMHVFRNVEALLILGFGLLCAAAWFHGGSGAPTAEPRPAVEVRDTRTAALPVVVVPGKRMSADEKRRSLDAEPAPRSAADKG